MEVEINADPPHDPTAEQIEAIGKAQPTGGEEPEGEPTLLANKFKDTAELEKAYLELQTKLGSETPAEPTETGGDDPAFSFKSKGGEETPTPKKVNAARYKQEMLEDGHLSEESQKEILEAGFDEEMIAQYQKGLEDSRDKRRDKILGIFGNKERMDQAIKWANANLPQQELDAIQTQATNMDDAISEAAIRGLVARFDSSPMGQEAPLEGTVGGPAIQGYADTSEMTADQGTDLYKKSSAERDRVKARIAATV